MTTVYRPRFAEDLPGPSVNEYEPDRNKFDDTNRTEEVLKMLTVVEMFLAGMCYLFHVYCYWNRFEPVGHTSVYCGTFVGFYVIHNLEILNAIFGYGQSLVFHASISFTGTILSLICALLPMMQAEHDIHLKFLTNYEELQHEAFWQARFQSIATLSMYCLYLMDTILHVDILLERRNIPERPIEEITDDDDPIALQFCCFQRIRRLSDKKFCRMMCKCIFLDEEQPRYI